MRKYTTVSGDTWDLIAYKTLGSDRLMHHILEANKNRLQTVIFEAGVVLEIPELQTKTPSTLPPWKR